MSGIFGYIGSQNAVPIIVEGLKRLEYRGHDSVGIGVLSNGELIVRKKIGRYKLLEEEFQKNPVEGTLGIGHTRWASHGKPTIENAHPQVAADVALVHNGIIENYQDLRRKLAAQGRTFTSETDTEVLAHLVDSHIGEGLQNAMFDTIKEVEGTFSLCVISGRDVDKLVAVRKENPLVIGLGEGEFYVASDVTAFPEEIKNIVFLEDGEIAVISKEAIKFFTFEQEEIQKSVEPRVWTPMMAEKGGYRFFLLKELYEQPRAVRQTVGRLISPDSEKIDFEDLGSLEEKLSSIQKIVIAGSGTSNHTALISKLILQELCDLPVEVVYGSEYRYQQFIEGRGTLFIAISQSGETSDVLISAKKARLAEATTIGVTNSSSNSLVRETDGALITHAGPEISVPATKSFTAMCSIMYCFGIYLGGIRGTLRPEEVLAGINEVRSIPGKIEEILNQEDDLEYLSRQFFDQENFLILGRGPNYPTALESAMKMKEITYIHAEGLPAGEVKYGPITLIQNDIPVVVFASQEKLYDNILLDIDEIGARDARLIVIEKKGRNPLGRKIDHLIEIPKTIDLLTPILSVVPMQLFTYHLALKRRCEIDHPKNIAKSVTV